MTRSGIASRLGRLARRPDPPAPATGTRCDLCGTLIDEAHRHLLDVQTRRLRCACRPCTVLFDRGRAGGAPYRVVPTRVRRLDALVLDDAAWASLRIPVDVAFFFHSTAAGRVVAVYPSPLGATESQLGLEAWSAVCARDPVLCTMEPDVEALLVDRTHGASRCWLVPIDACYRLVGVVRTHWKGLGGGPDVWAAIARIFDSLEKGPSNENTNREQRESRPSGDTAVEARPYPGRPPG